MKAVVHGYFNQSGGCGKTTTVASLSVEFARRGMRVLIIDSDGQRDLSKIFGFDAPEKIPGQLTLPTILQYPEKKKIDSQLIHRAIVSTQIEGVPTGVDLLLGGPTDDRLERHIASSQLPETWMVRVVREIEEEYDLIMIDGPASMGIIGRGALNASTRVFGVSTPQEKEMRGITELEGTILDLNESTRGLLHLPPLTLDAIIMCEVPTSRSGGAIYHDIIDLAVQQYGGRLLQPYIRKSVRVPEAYSNQIPLPLYAPEDGATSDYLALAGVIVEAGLTRPRSHRAVAA